MARKGKAGQQKPSLLTVAVFDLRRNGLSRGRFHDLHVLDVSVRTDRASMGVARVWIRLDLFGLPHVPAKRPPRAQQARGRGCAQRAESILPVWGGVQTAS